MNGGKPPGFVYLIHFDQPIGNPGISHGRAQHYTGHTDDLDTRTEDHHGAHAVAIMRAVNQQGIGWRVVRTWEGTRDTERQIKLLRAGNRLCPECTPNPLSAAAAITRAQEIHRAREATREATRPLPRNRDGSISRSRTTDAQKAAVGLMTTAKQAEHTALRRDLGAANPPAPPSAARWMSTRGRRRCRASRNESTNWRRRADCPGKKGNADARHHT